MQFRGRVFLAPDSFSTRCSISPSAKAALKQMTNTKTIFILLDGCRYEAARECLGYMEALVRENDAQVYEVASELPSLSRPLYETLMSGLPPVRHGVTSNNVVRRSKVENVFSLATAAGLHTAAAAYNWHFELHNQAPFSPEFRHVEDFPGDIRDGFFYWDDGYPDSHLFADADDLLRRRQPDFLLLHPMNVDWIGHRSGGASREYRNAIRHQSDLLAVYLPAWQEAGYSIIVTSDHGMSDDGNHCGPHPAEATVPLYTVGKQTFSYDPNARIAQREIAGMLCRMLGISPGAEMSVPQGILKNEV